MSKPRRKNDFHSSMMRRQNESSVFIQEVMYLESFVEYFVAVDSLYSCVSIRIINIFHKSVTETVSRSFILYNLT